MVGIVPVVAVEVTVVTVVAVVPVVAVEVTVVPVVAVAPVVVLAMVDGDVDNQVTTVSMFVCCTL